MHNSITLIDLFLRGIGAGAMLLMGLSAFRSGVSRDHRLALSLFATSIVCWLITESPTLWPAFGSAYVLELPTFAVGAFFWLFVVTVFEDRPITLLSLAPAAAQLALGLLGRLPHPIGDGAWVVLNVTSGLLALHAVFIVAKGWGGDLIEGRRRLRGPLLGLSALFAGASVVFAFAARLNPDGPWLQYTGGRPYGGAFLSAIMLATAAAFLQMRPAVFGSSRRQPATVDPRIEAAERLLLGKLTELMAGGAWRQEGLTIGDVAGQLQSPEHRLRRLINQRLGHRNFAEFVNGYRIEAARQRLADPAEARTTVAAIAFELGYGSLGPFNRAFRAATGSTPSGWRRQALATPPDLEGVA